MTSLLRALYQNSTTTTHKNGVTSKSINGHLIMMLKLTADIICQKRSCA